VPLPEFTDEVVRGWAARLVALHRGALADRADLLRAMGRADEAVSGLVSEVDADPCWERGTAALVPALAEAGRVGDALAVLRRHREAIVDTLGLDPSRQIMALQTALLHGDLARAPGAPEGRAVVRDSAVRVPLRFSSFVGRDAEQARLGALLADPGLVSVTGPGGVGKTRLVTETVRAAAAEVCWVDVADARGRDDLLQAVAIGVGARPGPQDDVLAVICAQAAGWSSLLVLDNCEHVIDPAAETVDAVLATAPGMRIVATSQERLRVDGERVLVLAPLPLPDTASPVGGQPAVRLFLDRAGSAVDGDDPVQLAAVADVVGRLDALPLAIELAATQCVALGPDALRDRLDDRFALLSRGRRTAEPRHRTLRALIDWSHELLSAEQARVLRRLAVFVGGFTVDLAERVVADDGLPSRRVAAVLADLVDRSLVTRHGPGRYRLLETLRVYAGERLLHSGELGALQRRHARAVVAAAEAEDLRMFGPEEAAAVAALTALLPDQRRAREFALAAGDSDLLVRLAAAQYRYGYLGQRYEVLAWGHDVTRLPGTHPRLPAALAAAATHAWGRSDLAAACALADRAVRAIGDSTDPGVQAAHEVRGDVALVTGDAGTALGHYRAIAEAGRRTGHPAIEVSGESSAALVLAWTGEPGAAQRAARSGVDLAERSGNPTARAFAAYSLGETLGDTDPEQALALLADAARLSRTVGNRLFEAAAGTAAVAIRSRHGEPGAALRSFPEVLTLWRHAGNDTLQATALRNLVVLLARIGADAAAATIDTAVGTGSDAQLYRAEADRMARARSAVAERLGPAQVADLRRAAATMTTAQVLDVALAAITDQLTRFAAR
jgi:predicted ATPase